MMLAEDNSDSESDEDYIPNEQDHECDDEANSNSSDSDIESGETKQTLKKRKKAEINNSEESSEPPKKSVDEMWDEFLRDTNSNSTSFASGSGVKNDETSTASVVAIEPSKKVVVTEVFDFAGEEIKITKEVDVNSVEACKQLNDANSKSTTASDSSKETSSSLKRSGGLNSVLNQIGKKRKLGTLEKSKYDWDNYKKAENLDEELTQHNRGRGGFLDKQDFLQRSDYRQFEKERDLRLSRKKNV